MNSINEVFPLVKENIKQKVSNNVYDLWINNIKDDDVKMENNVVIIEVSNNFIKGVLENNNFIEKVAEGFQEILGFTVNVALLSKDSDDTQNNFDFNSTSNVTSPNTNTSTNSNTNISTNTSTSPNTNTGTSPDTNTGNSPDNNTSIDTNPSTNINMVTPTEPLVNPNVVIPQEVPVKTEAAPIITAQNIVNSDNNSNIAGNTNTNDYYNFTFETFIVGPSNQFAYVNCKSITEPQSVVKANPLFIYGPSGLGKTHLLRAIENAIRVQHPEKNIISVSSETFTNDIITAIGKQQTEEFRNKYRAADILLVDDVQFIAGKESTQVEFFNTFNALYDAGKQIVLTSDRPPKDIKTLEDRLRTRFEEGMIADVNYPDFETRIAIINKKADELGLSLQPEVSAFIAENLKTHIRQLGGIVKKLQSYQLLTGKITDLSLAQTVIKEVLSNNQPLPITVEKIIDEVAKSYSVTSDDIRSNKRNGNLSTVRQVAFYIIKETTNMPLSDIGKEFSDRDHSTITYHIKQIQKKIKTDAKLSATIDDIIKNIESK